MWLLLFLVVLFITQIVFAILGLGGLVDWSPLVLVSPLLVFVGLFLFLFGCSVVNQMTPTRRVIESDKIGVDDETSAEWIAQLIRQGNITIDNVAEQDRDEVTHLLDR